MAGDTGHAGSRRYADAIAVVARIAQEALAIGLAGGASVAEVAMPATLIVDAMLPVEFRLPASLTEPQIMGAGSLVIGGQFGAAPIASDASAIAGQVMAILRPLNAEVGRQAADQHRANVRQHHEQVAAEDQAARAHTARMATAG
jgi:hypothetical protein